MFSFQELRDNLPLLIQLEFIPVLVLSVLALSANYFRSGKYRRQINIIATISIILFLLLMLLIVWFWAGCFLYITCGMARS